MLYARLCTCAVPEQRIRPYHTTVCIGAFSVWVEHNEMLDIADPAILV